MIRNDVMIVNCCACFVFQRIEMFSDKITVNLIKKLFDCNKRLLQVNGFYAERKNFAGKTLQSIGASLI